LSLCKDEYPRETSLEKLAQLKPAFREGGSVTAGNSSGINDGAAAALLIGESYLKTFSQKPLARVMAMAVAGVDPAFMGVGPVPAVKKALQRAGLKISDIGLLELNEAFAAQSLACHAGFGNRSAIGKCKWWCYCTGSSVGLQWRAHQRYTYPRNEKRNVKYGVATMCIGVGQGAAIVYENCQLSIVN
jgi:acetyl-CoA acetyltransferase